MRILKNAINHHTLYCIRNILDTNDRKPNPNELRLEKECEQTFRRSLTRDDDVPRVRILVLFLLQGPHPQIHIAASFSTSSNFRRTAHHPNLFLLVGSSEAWSSLVGPSASFCPSL